MERRGAGIPNIPAVGSPGCGVICAFGGTAVLSFRAGLLSTSELRQDFGLVWGCFLHLWVVSEAEALPCFPLGQSQIHGWLFPLNGITPLVLPLKPSQVSMAPIDEHPWTHRRFLAKENLQMSPRSEPDINQQINMGMFASQMGQLSLTLPPGEECPGKQSLGAGCAHPKNLLSGLEFSAL